MVNESNKIVNGLWIGDTLSALELLTLRSFARHGHTFRLWTYGPLETPLPDTTILRDANEILDESHVFSYRHSNTVGHGKGSVAGFSDIFRYKLLYEEGGWWSDMDITALRPLDFPEPYVFRNHDVLPVVGNLMKCPKGSELMKACFDISLREVDAENTDWLLPIAILNDEIKRLDLLGYVKKDISNADRWEIVDHYRHFDPRLPNTFYVIHWMNEEWRSRNLDKNTCYRGSLLAKVVTRNHVKMRLVRLKKQRLKKFVQYLRMKLYPLLPRPLRKPLKWLAVSLGLARRSEEELEAARNRPKKRPLKRILDFLKSIPGGLVAALKSIPRGILWLLRVIVHFLKMNLYPLLPRPIQKPLKRLAGGLGLDKDPHHE